MENKSRIKSFEQQLLVNTRKKKKFLHHFIPRLISILFLKNAGMRRKRNPLLLLLQLYVSQEWNSFRHARHIKSLSPSFSFSFLIFFLSLSLVLLSLFFSVAYLFLLYHPMLSFSLPLIIFLSLSFCVSMSISIVCLQFLVSISFLPENLFSFFPISFFQKIPFKKLDRNENIFKTTQTKKKFDQNYFWGNFFEALKEKVRWERERKRETLVVFVRLDLHLVFIV